MVEAIETIYGLSELDRQIQESQARFRENEDVQRITDEKAAAERIAAEKAAEQKDEEAQRDHYLQVTEAANNSIEFIG